MADERLRRLERAAANDPAARVRWYQARLLQGDLTHLRLKLAAHLGDEAALEAIGPHHYNKPDTFSDWAKILTGGGKETSVRAALAAVRDRATGRWSAVFEAVQDWIDCPCRDHARAAGLAASTMAASRGLWTDAVYALGIATSELNLTRAAEAACSAILRTPHADAQTMLSVDEQERIRAAIARELLPWLLGDREPLPPTELSDPSPGSSRGR